MTSKYSAPKTWAPFNSSTAPIQLIKEESLINVINNGEYLKYTFPNCRGSFISPSFKDNEYYAQEYTIKSRPALNTSLYSVDLVSELPVGIVAFRHPAIEALED